MSSDNGMKGGLGGAEAPVLAERPLPRSEKVDLQQLNGHVESVKLDLRRIPYHKVNS